MTRIDTMPRPLNRLNDYLFKRVFGAPDGAEVLAGFLNAVLDPPAGKRIADLTYLDRELDPDHQDGKASRLDLLVRTQAGTRYNVEVQVSRLTFHGGGGGSPPPLPQPLTRPPPPA